jgi:hypothetical protein
MGWSRSLRLQVCTSAHLGHGCRAAHTSFTVARLPGCQAAGPARSRSHLPHLDTLPGYVRHNKVHIDVYVLALADLLHHGTVWTAAMSCDQIMRSTTTIKLWRECLCARCPWPW